MTDPYRFFTVLGATRRQFFPLNARTLKLEYKLADDECRFAFVEDFAGLLVMDNRSGDYDYFYGLETSGQHCRALKLEIEKVNCAGDYVPWKEGKIRLVDATFELDNCVLSVKPLIQNEYSCYEDNKDKEVNLFDFPIPRITVNYLKGTIEKTAYDAPYNYNLDDPSHFGGVAPASIGWACYKMIRHTATLPPTYSFYYAREVLTAASSPGPEWIDIGGGQWARLPLLIYDWQNTDTSPAFGDQFTINYTVFGDGDGGDFENGLLLSDVLSYFVSTYCGINVKSNFLQINPTATFTETYPLFDDGLTFTDVLFQKSDAKRPNDSNKATKALTTFKKILVQICQAYNLQWKIDTDFIIEHVSFFGRSVTMDTTDTAAKRKDVVRTRTYSYKTDKMPRKETFEFMEAGTDDFLGKGIEYPGDCASDDEGNNVIDMALDSLTTDIEYLLQNSQSTSTKVSDEGFALMATQKEAATGKYYLFTVAPTLETKRHLNNALGWAYLLKSYYRHNRLQLNGYLNGDYQTFLSTKATKKRITIGVKFCCDQTIDLSGLVVTNMGQATIDGATFTLYQDELTLDLVYGDTLGNVSCLKPKLFRFHHYDDTSQAFFFQTQFFTSGLWMTEIEATRPDGTKQFFSYNPDVEGLYGATFPPAVSGVWRFRKRILCDIGFEGPWSDYVSVDTNTVTVAGCFAVTATFLRRQDHYFVFRFNDIDIPVEAEITTPVSATQHIVSGETTLNGTALPRSDRAFYVSTPPLLPSAPLPSGLYRFLFRRVCNAASGIFSTWSTEVDVNV